MSSRPVNQEPEDPNFLDTIANHFIEKEPKEIPRPSTDVIINDFYDLCDGWFFKFNADQWWVLRASCTHGICFKPSKSLSDFTETLLDLYKMAEEMHKKVAKND